MDNRKILTIHQPECFPWLGLMNKISQCDVLVLLDSVTYRKNYFQNRNKIYPVKKDKDNWITIPVEFHNTETLIKDVEISNNVNWQVRMLAGIYNVYKNCPFFDQRFTKLMEIMQLSHVSNDNLAKFNERILKYFMSCLGIKTKIIRSSSIYGIDNIHKSDLIYEICEYVKDKYYNDEPCRYLAGPFGRDYLDVDKFTSSGINVVYNDYDPMKYKYIQHQDVNEFVPYLSVLDLLMNHNNKVSEGVVKEHKYYE